MTTWRAAARVAAAVLLLAAATPGPRAQEAPAAERAGTGEIRTWTDISGKFSREAEFLKLEDGKVHLRLPSGKETRIPLKELSKKDRDWVRGNGAPKGVGGAKGVATRIVLRSYETLASDNVLLAQLLDQQAFAGAVPGFFVSLTGGKPLAGFDVKKPVVITIHVDSRGQQSGTMVAVPVTGKDQFQTTLDAVFPVKSTPKGKAHDVAMLQKSVYVKPGERYFLLADSADILRDAPADPEAPVVVADISAETYFTAMPEAERTRSIAEFEALLAARPPDPNLPEAGRKSAEMTQRWLTDSLRMLLTDGDRATFEAGIDPATSQVSFSLGVRARSGTPLAESFASYGALRPRFVAAGNTETLGWVGVSMPKGEWLRLLVETSLDGGVAGMRQALEGLRGQPGHAEAEAALGELEVEIGKLRGIDHYEQEFVFTGDPSGKPAIVTRIAYDDAPRFLAAVSKLTAIGAAGGVGVPDADGIVSFPMPQAGPQAAISAHPARVAATADALVFGFDCPDNAPVKALMTKASAGSAVSPISARVDLARLWPAFAAMNPMTAALGGAVGENGVLRADVGALSDGIEMRLNVDAGVLKLLGALGSVAAQGMPGMPGGMGAPPGPFGAPGAPMGAPMGAPGGPRGVPKRPPAFGAPDAGGAPPTIQGFPTPPIPQPGPPQAPPP